MSRTAVLIEDDDEAVLFTSRRLREQGFSPVVFGDAESASAGISKIEDMIDLVVIDRRLPVHASAEPDDSVGDALLNELLDWLPDVSFVVFSGHTGFHHLQFATRDRGVIRLPGREAALDRVYVFDKDQAPEFNSCIQKIRTVLDDIDAIDVSGVSSSGLVGQSTRRLLREVARHFDGSMISATALRGGLTGASVYGCQIENASGLSSAGVVVKMSTSTKPSSNGGLHTILPAASIAAPIAVVEGFAAGRRAKVMQVAGAEAQSLFAMIKDSPPVAAGQVNSLRRIVKGNVRGGIRTLTLEELAAPLAGWELMEGNASDYAIELPPRSWQSRTSVGAQHGDLHPGNILVVNGNPVLIDFDSETSASQLLDPLVLLLSGLFHPDSPLRGDPWPSPDQCVSFYEPEFFAGSSSPEWFRACLDWVVSAQSGEREMWTLVLAYCLRQLKYKNIREDRVMRSRAVLLARRASKELLQA